MASTLASMMAISVAFVLAIFSGYVYQMWANQIHLDYFSLPDQCSGAVQKQHPAMLEFSRNALRSLEDIRYPDRIDMDNLPSDIDDVTDWIAGGERMVAISGGGWYIAVDSDMSGISGEVLRSWFELANCTDMYRWWHPEDHIYGVWIGPATAQQPASSNLVYRHGSTHRVKEYVNGELDKLDIRFQDPCVNRQCSILKDQGVELILSANITVHQTGVGRVRVGNFTHLLRVHDTATTLHSRFTVGLDIECLDDPDSWGCYFFKSTAWLLKKFLLGEAKARGIFRHCKEEMTVLGKVLRKLNTPNA